MIVLGLDVSKNDLHAAVIGEGTKLGKHSFSNNPRGHQQLLKWLENRGVAKVHACLEATGGFGEDLAIMLGEHGHVVSIVNPRRIKAFGQSEGVRTKTDAVDAALIARFCQVHVPDPWTPPTPAERALQALLRRRDNLIDMRIQETNRSEAPRTADSIRSSIQEHIRYLEEQIAAIEAEIRKLVDGDSGLRAKSELIRSIPGIGETTANGILGEVPNLSEFRDVKAVGANAGLSPAHNQSGLSPGHSKLCKAGNARLRKIMFFPALVAIEKNPVIKAFADRLRARGKRPMVIVAAAMRKLLIIVYGVLKSGRPFMAPAS